MATNKRKITKLTSINRNPNHVASITTNPSNSSARLAWTNHYYAPTVLTPIKTMTGPSMMISSHRKWWM